MMKHIAIQTALTLSLLIYASIMICPAATGNAEQGNIHEVRSEITFNGSSLSFHNKVTFRVNKDSYAHHKFYLNKHSSFNGLKVTNEKGEKLKYSIIKEKDSCTAFRINNNNHVIFVDYNLDLSKVKSSITYFRNDNQCFLLPEMFIFPQNNIEFTPDNIYYSVVLANSSKRYSYIKVPPPEISPLAPYLIMGNFTTLQHNGVRVYIPSEISVDKEKLRDITSLIADAYTFYSKLFGKGPLTKEIEVFFLNRRGGYGIKEGIILDQKYVTKDEHAASDDMARLIGHEVAHLWWGIGVRATSWAITEGLAELSAEFYTSKNDKAKTKDFYANKNIVVQNSHIKPMNINTLSAYDKGYKSISYHKLPIIFHAAEIKIGRDGLQAALRDFYLAELNTLRLCGTEEIIAHFPPDYQAKLRKDLDGSIGQWPDYYIKDVCEDNRVVFKGDHVRCKEIVPVELITVENEAIRDTLYFDTDNNEIERCYDKRIARIIIDGDFATNQSVLLNDFWSKEAGSTLDNKWQYLHKRKYRVFADALLAYLFTDREIPVNDFAVPTQRAFLTRAKQKLQRIRIDEAFLSIRTRDRYFKVIIAYLYENEGFKTGFIEGYYEEDEREIVRLKEVLRVAI